MSLVDELLGHAATELGKPYVFGDEGPGSFDCSGLMQWVYGKIGISLPRTAAQQQRAATPVSSPRPGDLVFYGRPAHHVALYIGNDKVINAPSAGEVVRIQSLWRSDDGPLFGRVPGLGAATAPITDFFGDATGAVGAAVERFLGGARGIVLTGLFVALGAGLVGFGLWRASSPARRKIITGGE